MNEEELKVLLLEDDHIYQILRIMDELALPDAWLCAGTLRNFIWNRLSGKPAFDKETDVDLVFFDKAISENKTLTIEKKLKVAYPDYQWELRNQANMHHHSPNTRPYQSARDAISKYPETCTAIAARLITKEEVELFLPYGLDDLVQFKVLPSPHFAADPQRMQVYHERLLKKNWQQKWPQLRFL